MPVNRQVVGQAVNDMTLVDDELFGQCVDLLGDPGILGMRVGQVLFQDLAFHGNGR